MLRIGVIEKEELAKDLIFALSKVLDDEFSFVHYEKISDFVKQHKTKDFDVIILNEAYNNIRVTSALEYQKNNTIIIYCSLEDVKFSFSHYSRIFTIRAQHYMHDIKEMEPFLLERLNSHKEYLFAYNGVKVRLKYHDIYYIEKEEKNLVYHTKKGEFQERGSIAKKSEELEAYDFIRIHSGIIVNYEYIFKIDTDELELVNRKKLPISRSRKAKLKAFIGLKNKI